MGIEDDTKPIQLMACSHSQSRYSIVDFLGDGIQDFMTMINQLRWKEWNVGSNLASGCQYKLNPAGTRQSSR